MVQPKLLPAKVAELLQRSAKCLAGICVEAGSCWFYAQSCLHVWMYDDASSKVFDHKLMYISAGKHYVKVLGPLPDGLAVSMCTSDGNMTFWENFCDQATEPFLVRVPGEVTAFTMSLPQQQATSFLSAIGTTEGVVYVLKGTQSSSGNFYSTTDKLDPATFQPAAKSVFGKVGQALFGGGFKHHKNTPSRSPSLKLHLLPLSDKTLLLVNTTQESVEFWQLQVQLDATSPPALIASLQLPQLVEDNGGVGSVQLLDSAVHCGPAPGDTSCVVLARGVSVDGPQLAVYSLQLPRGLGQAANLVETFPLEDVDLVGGGHQLCCDAAAENVCVWREGGPAHAVHLPSGDTHKVSSHAIACTWSADGSGDMGDDGVGGCWLVLDAAHGLLQLDVETVEEQVAAMHDSGAVAEDAPEGSWEGAGQAAAGSVSVGSGVRGVTPTPPRESSEVGLSSAQELAALDTLEQAVSGQLPTSLLLRHLDNLCVLGVLGAASPVVLFSDRVVDSLPKHWGTLGAAAVTQHLQEKVVSHDALLHVLQEGHVLQQLQPSVLRLLFEAGQKLRALLAVRQLENALIDGRSDPTAVATLQALINYAGGQCMTRVSSAGLQERSEWEVFYSTPTATAPALFDSLAAMCSTVGGEATHVAADLQQITHMRDIMQCAVSGSQSGLRQYHSLYPQEINNALGKVLEPDWTAQEAARKALQQMTEACRRVLLSVDNGGPQHREEAVELMLQLTQQLLNSYAAAAVAVGPSRQAVLVEEYAALRHATLQQLLEEGKRMCQEGSAAGPLVLQHLESLAEVHEGYSQLMEIGVMGDTQRLYGHMAAVVRDGMPKFAFFVFARLFENGDYHTLLTLPDDFNQVLYSWLMEKGKQDGSHELLQVKQLHEIRLGYFAEASATLQALARNPEAGPMRSAQRAVCLSKLSALCDMTNTDRRRDSSAPMLAMDRQLALMRVQESIGLSESAVLDAADVVSACLKKGDAQAVQMAVEAIAAAGKEFRSQHSSLVEAAWRGVIISTNWGALVDQRNNMSDTDYLDTLSRQPLAAAAARCFGDGALPLDEGLEDSITPEQVLDLVKSCVVTPVQALQAAQSAFTIGCGGAPMQIR